MLSKSFVLLSLASLVFSAPLSRRALDLGSCADATIKFANGLDGRNQPAFEPTDLNSFAHGSALGIGVITSFICQQLNDKCKAPTATITACNAGAAAAAAKTGQAAADAFNAAITGGAGAAAASSGAGAASSGSAASGSSGSAAAGDAGAAACPPQATVTVTAAASSATEAAANPPAAASNPPAASAPAASGANLQKFTGTLGGSPPPVTAGGSKGFVVDGSEFINEAGALKRSCDVQHNLCANAANAGGGFSVAQCDAQDTACSALAAST